MPRNRMLLQLDDELVLAKHALTFWREHAFMADPPLRACAVRAVKLHEQQVQQLVDIQEHLSGM